MIHPKFHGRVWTPLRESVRRGIPQIAIDVMADALLYETQDRSHPDRIIVGFFHPRAESPTVMINLCLDSAGEEVGFVDAIARRVGPDAELPDYVVQTIEEVAEDSRRSNH